MKVHRLFFSFKTTDKSRVEKLRKGISELLPNFPFEDSSADVPHSQNWQDHATSAIAISDGLICVVGETTHESKPVNWEIEEAVRLGKPVIVARKDTCKLPEACERLRLQFVTPEPSHVADQICDLLIPRALLDGGQSSLPSDRINQLWNQYSLMVQSWEALIGRRQTVNNLYLTANTTLLAGIGVFLGQLKSVGAAPSLSGSTMLSALGALLSLNWIQTIVSYGTLSQAKSKVVLALETYMPAKLFDTEWAVLESKRYRSTTSSDKRTAQFFFLLFLIILGVAIGMIMEWIPRPI